MNMTASALPDLAAIEAAAKRLAGQAIETPLLESHDLNARTGARVFIKPETLQRTGSFKFRGAFNKISQLPQGAKGGVVAFSSGNHVLDELTVPGRVDDHVVARRRAQPDLGGIDGDALVALGLEGIHEERPFEGHAAPLAHRLDGLELALGQRAGIVDQATDEGRLAVIDMADDDDAQLIAHGGRRIFGARHHM